MVSLPVLIRVVALCWLYFRMWLWSPAPANARSRRRLPEVEPVEMRAHPRNKPAWALPALIVLASRTPTSMASCRKLARRFNQRFERRAVSVGRTWVAERLELHAEVIAERRRRWRARPPRNLPINDTWAIDLTGLREADGSPATVLGLIDHGSRGLLELRAMKQKNSIAVLRVLLDACERHGVPRALRADNEAMFTSGVFRFALRWLGIKPQRSEPGCPWQNGRIERFFSTLKRELDALAPATLGAIPLRLAMYRNYYNGHRPHMALGDRTPAQVWRASWNGLKQWRESG